MANDIPRHTNPENLNPAKRAADSIESAAANLTDIDIEGAEDFVIVDEKLKAKEGERLQNERLAREEAAVVETVTSERSAAPIIMVMSERNTARLLVLTRNVAVFEQGSLAALHMKELEAMFAEVHVIVLNTRKQGKFETTRISDYVWAYPTNSFFWWKTMWDAKKVARTQLTFGDGFRPDIIIAKDPFESGIAGRAIGRKYERPFQIHVSDDLFDPIFKDLDSHNSWRLVMANSLLRHITCVRTQSEYLQGRLVDTYKNLKDHVDLFPIFYNINVWKDTEPAFSLADRYPQFKFRLLHITNMNIYSHTDVAIDGLFYILKQYPTIGLIIVGDGPEYEALQKTVAEYELGAQIIFESPDIDILSCMKSSHVLIHTSEESSQEETVIQAASVGLAMVCGNRGVVPELFIDSESVFLCPVDSPTCFGERVNQLLNHNELRQKLAINARDVVFESIEQDYDAYIAAYRSSIERCLTISS